MPNTAGTRPTAIAERRIALAATHVSSPLERVIAQVAVLALALRIGPLVPGERASLIVRVAEME